ncbi:hypothetical protein [Micromonospora humida]|uniref:Uncharacterized protein n=1 Tax=Micromonospora humida TaxID=2809018 RepID=A0ABS2IVH1_9ACTN|nr:hypothetical protein [Micromonospora humida]MBM7078342.1 hypothetical protein [Micromonospora humida]
MHPDDPTRPQQAAHSHRPYLQVGTAPQHPQLGMPHLQSVLPFTPINIQGHRTIPSLAGGKGYVLSDTGFGDDP